MSTLLPIKVWPINKGLEHCVFLWCVAILHCILSWTALLPLHLLVSYSLPAPPPSWPDEAPCRETQSRSASPHRSPEPPNIKQCENLIRKIHKWKQIPRDTGIACVGISAVPFWVFGERTKTPCSKGTLQILQHRSSLLFSKLRSTDTRGCYANGNILLRSKYGQHWILQLCFAQLLSAVFVWCWSGLSQLPSAILVLGFFSLLTAFT